MQNPVFLMVFEITSKSGQNKVKLAAKHFKNHGFEPVFCGNSTKINGKMVKNMVKSLVRKNNVKLRTIR